VVLGVVLARYILQKPDSGKDEEEKDPEEACKRLAITPREYEVLKLLANGHSNFEISQALFISESTVKTHVSNLMTKLDAKRRTQVVRKAQELGLL
jgi:DNA-binding NarL/FixJ family response regulator